jgi:starch phosphorylase
MKGAYNGIPQLSTLDGWWLEGHIEDVTGWKIGPRPGKSWLDDIEPEEEDHLDANDLYNQLENKVVPTYYHQPDKWAEIMRNAMAFNGPYFHTGRMVREYVQEAYKR